MGHLGHHSCPSRSIRKRLTHLPHQPMPARFRTPNTTTWSILILQQISWYGHWTCCRHRGGPNDHYFYLCECHHHPGRGHHYLDRVSVQSGCPGSFFLTICWLCNIEAKSGPQPSPQGSTNGTKRSPRTQTAARHMGPEIKRTEYPVPVHVWLSTLPLLRLRQRPKHTRPKRLPSLRWVLICNIQLSLFCAIGC